MNLARWSIDYMQKKQKADPSPRPTVTDLLVGSKDRNHEQGNDAPEHIRRILAADEAQLETMTSERNKLFIKEPKQKSATMVSSMVSSPQREELTRRNKEHINFKNQALLDHTNVYSIYGGMKAVDLNSESTFPGSASQSH